jgi:ribonuclease HIII
MNEVIKANQTQLELLVDSYGSQAKASPVAHIRAVITLDQCIITAYRSGSIVFQGPAATEHYHEWQSVFAESFRAHIGSDEVGTGDVFGPVVVCAAFVNEADEAYLRSIGVGDSKTFSDQKIIEMATLMLPLIPHRQVVLMPTYYNKLYAKHPNLNHIKALLHNRAILALMEQTGPVPVVMDQFVHEKKYFEYLSHQKTVHKAIAFHTKAESKFIAVAAASIFARYYFLESWKVMEQQANRSLPKGAGALVDKALEDFFATTPATQWDQFAKLHFKNIKKIQTIH